MRPVASLRVTHYYPTLAIKYGRFAHYDIHWNFPPADYNLMPSDGMQRARSESLVTDAERSYEIAISRPELSALPHQLSLSLVNVVIKYLSPKLL